MLNLNIHLLRHGDLKYTFLQKINQQDHVGAVLNTISKIHLLTQNSKNNGPEDIENDANLDQEETLLGRDNVEDDKDNENKNSNAHPFKILGMLNSINN